MQAAWILKGGFKDEVLGFAQICFIGHANGNLDAAFVVRKGPVNHFSRDKILIGNHDSAAIKRFNQG